MRTYHRTRRRPYTLAVLLALLSLVLAPLWSVPAQAAKEAVYLSDTVHFSLQDVMLSAATDSQTLRFTVNLANDSEASIDFNAYGVRVSDTAGNSYSAQLSEKTTARVQPHKTQPFKYSSNIAAGLKVDDLSVVLFAWDAKEADYMRDIGSLSIAVAAADQPVTKQAVILNMDEVDTALPDDASVSFQPIGGTKVVKDGAWTMYVDLRVENLGSTGFKLPAALTYQLVDAHGLTVSATAMAGVDTLLPHQPVKITLQAPVGGTFTEDPFSVQFINKQTTTSNLIGTLSISDPTPAVAGQTREYPAANPNGLDLTIVSTSYAPLSDGVAVETTIKLTNNGKSVVNAPKLTGAFQLNSSGLSVASVDPASASAYISPKDSQTFLFTATLPAGVDIADVNFVLSEKKAGTTANTTVVQPILHVNLSGASPLSTPGAGTVFRVNTSAGPLAIELKRTQRLTLESDDVILSEISVRNESSTIATLPALYGGIALGDFEVKGKAIRLQTSSYLNPSESTTVYLYSKIPYSLEAEEGIIFLGEGTLQTNSNSGNGNGTTGNSGTTSGASGTTNTTNAAANTTVTPSQEWARISFSLKSDDGIPSIQKETAWSITDQGRQSDGKIVDARVFTLGTQKMLAVRLLQTGKEKRVGSIVPYTGYFEGPDGLIWTTKVTEETGRLCNGCAALSTLWVTLPDTVSNDWSGYTLVFGQKLDDTAMTSVHRYSLANLPGTLDVPVAHLGTYMSSSTVQNLDDNVSYNLGTVDLYPYTVQFTDVLAFKLPSAANINRYELDLKYNMAKTAPTIGGNKNRSLVIELRDLNDTLMKAWDLPFEGAGSLSNGDVNLVVDVTGNDIVHLSFPRVYIYEKFEGALRLLGTSLMSKQSQ
ncbi:hypothetical protein [Paenibacillus sp. HJGM_3]|uniref:hypothetical protein n=1 Tax=Paenibacillus sp. HJGM_3 TaxID=3379816 RepID=UPI00385EEED0